MTLITACLLFGTLVAAAPNVEVTLLDGQGRRGTLASLSGTELTLRAGEETVTYAAADLLELRFTGAVAEDTLEQQRRFEVRLVDGTLLRCTAFTSTPRTATLTTDVVGQLELPLAQIRSVRLGELDSKVRDAWDELRARETRNDLLVVRKGNALDFVGGVAADVTEQSVKMLVNDRDVPVPRERVFGIVYPRPAPASERAVCELALDSGDRLRLTGITLTADEASATLVAGPLVTVPAARIRAVDFGLGRVKYLADMSETADYEPVGLITSEDVQKLRKNSNSLGGPLKVGRATYARGLWLHSGTVLKYRLNREYRRLQGIVGMERSSDSCARLAPAVHVTILGDGKSLLEGDFTWAGEPQPMDLDVAGIRDLEIRVQPVNKETLGACEHLAIAEARAVK
jgi:hypothetical protein